MKTPPTDDAGFLRTVREFVDVHWPPARRRPRGPLTLPPAQLPAAERAWFEALAERGWSVPGWPRVLGGPGWSPAQQYLWARETAAAWAPRLDSAGTDVVGPLLGELGSPAQQAVHLPAIRDARARWCLALDPDSPVVLAGTPGSSRPARVSGTLAALPGAALAGWLLCRAEGPGTSAATLLLIDLAADGVTVTPAIGLDGAPGPGTVSLNRVRVPAAAVLGEPRGGDAALARLDTLPGTLAPRAPELAACCGQIRALFEDLAPDDDQTDAARSRLTGLEVAVVALEGLERRALAAPAENRRVLADQRTALADQRTALAAAARVRRTALTRELTALAASALGYYALAYPRPHHIDNEGPIGHDYALAAVAAALQAVGEGTTHLDKNSIARWLSGL